jgi:hypothetical protein
MREINKHTLRNRTILLVSPEPWDYIFVSKHHYAMELARRGNKVFFLNPPVTGIAERMQVNRADNFDNLFIVNYVSSFRGLRFLPRHLMNQLEKKFLRSLERKAGVRIDVILNFENSRFYDFRFAGKDVLKLYFQVDENQDFHPAEAAATADIAFAINTEILEIIEPYAKHAFKLPHSFQGELSEQALAVLEEKYKYKRPDGPLKVMYVGNLDNMYIDTLLFEDVVKKNPQVEFLLVGPSDPEKDIYRRLHQYAHVKFLGKKPAREIPALLSTADALMLVYGRNFTSSSHKLLEYLGSGKTVISTFMSEFAEFASLVYMTFSADHYTELFKEALNNIELLNSPDNMRARIQYALDHSYARQLDRMEQLIETAIAGS